MRKLVTAIVADEMPVATVWTSDAIDKQEWRYVYSDNDGMMKWSRMRPAGQGCVAQVFAADGQVAVFIHESTYPLAIVSDEHGVRVDHFDYCTSAESDQLEKYLERNEFIKTHIGPFSLGTFYDQDATYIVRATPSTVTQDSTLDVETVRASVVPEGPGLRDAYRVHVSVSTRIAFLASCGVIPPPSLAARSVAVSFNGRFKQITLDSAIFDTPMEVMDTHIVLAGNVEIRTPIAFRDVVIACPNGRVVWTLTGMGRITLAGTSKFAEDCVMNLSFVLAGEADLDMPYITIASMSRVMNFPAITYVTVTVPSAFAFCYVTQTNRQYNRAKYLMAVNGRCNVRVTGRIGVARTGIDFPGNAFFDRNLLGLYDPYVRDGRSGNERGFVVDDTKVVYFNANAQYGTSESPAARIAVDPTLEDVVAIDVVVH